MDGTADTSTKKTKPQDGGEEGEGQAVEQEDHQDTQAPSKKVDEMIIQAITLLDDLDKQRNMCAMRVKEWYGWHFPELVKIVSGDVAYVNCVKAMGARTQAPSTSFAGILSEEIEAEVREAAKTSIGQEISEEDISSIRVLCAQALNLNEHRNQLHDYIKNRMQVIAPNVSDMVGELAGARLIAQAGSLSNLIEYPITDELIQQAKRE